MGLLTSERSYLEKNLYKKPNKPWTVLNEWNLRLSSGLHIHVHIHSTHMNLHTQWNAQTPSLLTCWIDMSRTPAEVCPKRERWTRMKTDSSKSEETFVARKASTSIIDISVRRWALPYCKQEWMLIGSRTKRPFPKWLLLSFSLSVFKILSWKQLRSSCYISLYSFPQLAHRPLSSHPSSNWAQILV